MKNREIWFHGTPLTLKTLRRGSTVTGDEKLAQVFACKPEIVSLEDDGRIRHNGKQTGKIYKICGPVKPGAIIPHPRSTMPEGLEYMTQTDFEIEFLYEFTASAEDLLNENEISGLMERHNRK